MPPRLFDDPVQARPTLIVGLGGTGTLICRYAHEEIAALFDGTIPPFVKFIALDTDAQEEDEVRKLNEADHFNLFNTPHLQLAEVMRGYERNPGYYPHLHWLSGMTLDSAYVGRGCQGLSRMGRVVLFELLDGVIRREVIARFEALNNPTLGHQTETFAPEGQFTLPTVKDPVIHIAASLCGGTGTGMLLDMAYNLRWWSNEIFGRTADIHAHLMLPEAFPIDSPRIMDKLRAVAITMLEQVELLTDGRRANLAVRYRNGVARAVERTMAPFDFCHLLSGSSPTGGDHRGSLSQMIGRMIRVMTVEPASQPISSDANNKQLDILSQMETANGRRLFLDSYGLHGGTPAHAGSDSPDLALRWVYQTLGRIADAPAQVPEGWDAKVEGALVKAVDQATRIEHLSGLMGALDRFAYQPAPGRPLPMPGEFPRAEWEAYFRALDEPRRKKAAAVVELAARKLVDQVGQLTREVLQEWPKQPALAHRSLELWHHRLQRARDAYRTARPASLEELADALRAEAERALEAKSREPGRPTPILAPDEIAAEIDRVLKGARPRIDDVFLHGALGPVLDRACERASAWVKASRRLADRGNERGQGPAAQAHGDVARPGPRPNSRPKANGTLTTPLFDLAHPDANARNGSAETASNSFYMDLVGPILEGIYKKILEQPRLDHAGLDRLLDAAFGDRGEALEAFLRLHGELPDRLFHKEPDRGSAATSPFLRAVSKVIDGAGARVSINQDRRYSETLDIIIAQQREGTCVPGLLELKVGRAYREALVTPAYEERTGLWVQLIQFRYGFCVEALDQWAEYQQARKRYLDRTRFQETDLWLDPAWARAYRDLLARCRPTGEPGGPAGEGSGRPVDVRATVARLHEAFR
ncbi:MAG TPA: tubulin-like doman-containing protein, partial [Isosphaeraceae bacterium]